MLTVPIIKSQPKTIQITYRKCTNQVYCYGYTRLVQQISRKSHQQSLCVVFVFGQVNVATGLKIVLAVFL